MKTNKKKIMLGLLACVTLLAVSCEPNTTAEEDSLYNTESVDGNKIKIPKNG
ncbi:hypothetical protein MNBD_BACTEROID03-2850 [hydrothermal vent metagenome]|uniref:Uncharacterized protein n=1 Tax=hydrothermal vent metagenome TaxID=652676 RepID=A0A3B0TVJ1_9ZZZZ